MRTVDELATNCAAITGHPVQAWESAVTAWRTAGYDDNSLLEALALGDIYDPDHLESSVKGTMAHHAGELTVAARELLDAMTPRWLVRLVTWASRRR